jgi:hypothetical protein
VAVGRPYGPERRQQVVRSHPPQRAARACDVRQSLNHPSAALRARFARSEPRLAKRRLEVLAHRGVGKPLAEGGDREVGLQPPRLGDGLARFVEPARSVQAAACTYRIAFGPRAGQ